MAKVRACSKLLRNLDIAPGLGVIGRLDLMGKDHGREEGEGGREGWGSSVTPSGVDPLS